MVSPILVLGASGNVGSEVVKSLLARGASVRAADLDPHKLSARFDGRVEPVAFDFLKPVSFAPAFEGVRRMFLLRPPQIADVKRIMFPALDAARSAGVRQVVFLSIIGVEQNTVVPHYKIEQWLKASGMAYTFLRCSFFMQNLSTTHRDEIKLRDEIFVPVGQARTSFIDARDIGACAAAALTEDGHENRAYDLTGAQALDYYETARLFSETLRREITYRSPSPLAFFISQVKRRYPLPYALVTTWLYSNTRSGMADRVTGEVQRLTGRPPFTMRQFIEDHRAVWAR